MKAVALLLILLSSDGYWFGGAENHITVQWSVIDGGGAGKEARPAAVLEWELVVGQAILARGKTQMAADGPTQVTLQAPAVRARTTALWRYRLRAIADDKELEHGEHSLNLFPRDLLEAPAKALASRKVALWDSKLGTAELLIAAGVTAKSIHNAEGLGMTRWDLILVAPGELTDQTMEQGRLLGHARSGATLVVFQQTQPPALFGYNLVPRRLAPPVPSTNPPAPLPAAHVTESPGAERPPLVSLNYLREHPLLAGFWWEDLRSLERNILELPALALPADEPVLEIVRFPAEVASPVPVPSEAVWIVRAEGTGRIILCQLPLQPWTSDPRAMQLLGNVLSYACTPVKPTPRPSERPQPPAHKTEKPTESTNPFGVNP